jgi:hypothetical protein
MTECKAFYAPRNIGQPKLVALLSVTLATKSLGALYGNSLDRELSLSVWSALSAGGKPMLDVMQATFQASPAILV